MSETTFSNLAPAPPGTNTGLSGAVPAPAIVRTHIIDRASDVLWMTGAVAFVVLLYIGRGMFGRVIDGGDGLLLLALAIVLVVLSSAFVFRFLISPMVGNQLRELAEVAEAVAAGDLTKHPEAAKEGGQLGRLARAMVAMTSELKALSVLLTTTSAATSRLSTDITQGTEHMAQAASGIADTAATLSEQANSMADGIQHLRNDAERLSSLALTITAGAHDGIDRNARLRALASENHERLDESTRHLESLAGDVKESAEATESLARATGQIREFVTLVQKIARQSKLLALNAAMEAARAGEQGEGFAVVATEVRRLASSAAEAAEQTDRLMNDVLTGMATARATSERALGAVQTVQAATEHGRASFTQVETAVVEAEEWTSAIANAASAGSALAAEITGRLGSLTSGTQSFASAMQDVAAASEEQSASTQEIAAAAADLNTAADRVALASQAFRT